MVYKESKKIFPLLFIIIVSLLLWYPIFNVYYLQDEWVGIGHIQVEGLRHVFSGANFFQLLLGESRPAARLLGIFLIGNNIYNTGFIAFFSLAFHTLNSYLAYRFSKKIIKNEIFSIAAAIFFLASSVSVNAVYWFSTSISTLPATTLIILATMKFFDYIKTNDKKTLYLILIFLYLSLLIKEISIPFFIFLPISYFLFKKINTYRAIRFFLPVIFFAFLAAAFKIYSLKSIQGQSALFITGNSGGFFSTLLARAIYYPLTSFSLQFIPPQLAVNLARGFTNIYYPFIAEKDFILVSQTIVLDLLATTLSCFLIGLIIWVGKKSTQIERKHVIFLIFFSISSFLPYIIISKSYAYLESRYYYLSTFSGTIIFFWILEKLFEPKKLIPRILVSLFVGSFIYFHIVGTRQELITVARTSSESKLFISELKNLKPNLSENKNIFYLTSDTDYYIPGNKVPFQSGLGYTIMVLYSNSGKIPKNFLVENYLYEIGAQGYKEEGPFGFGYFTDKSKVVEALRENKFEKKNVTAFNYDSKTHQLSPAKISLP